MEATLNPRKTRVRSRFMTAGRKEKKAEKNE
jgi:hypothetical protein